jgi:polysaccharide export outer membrane protein
VRGTVRFVLDALRSALYFSFLGVWLTAGGCATQRVVCPDPAEDRLPKELAKIAMPPYVIETPDILAIDAVRVTPKPPYKIEPLDALLIKVTGVLPSEPISGIYPVEPDGTVNLGLAYGSVPVADLSLTEARDAIEKHLKVNFKEPKAVVSLAQARALQQIRGEHLVRPDGMVSLGTYGNVHIGGLTVPQAKDVIEAHLRNFLSKPEVSVDVIGYNSKVYYVIIDLAGYGQQVIRLPLTGNETVLDAVAQLNGLPAAASKKRIWVARPAPAEMRCQQILPVDWCAITKGGSTATNYQLLPGDRIYVEGDPLIATDSFLAKLISPMERVFGIVLLGNSTIQNLKHGNNTNGVGVP